MHTNPRSISDWQLLSKTQPESVLDRFYDQIDSLSLDARDALIANQYDRVALLQKIMGQTAGDDPPLAGVPYLLQDMIDAPGLSTACGSPFRAPFEAEIDTETTLYSALDELGAFLLAKTVPAEFGVDPRGRNRGYGDCLHPDDPELITGGGAGSSVCAVRQGLAPIAFGLDTSGGMRIPCAFQGAFGFRMGNNAFTQQGVFPIMPSIESVAFATNSIDDLATCYSAFFESDDQAYMDTPRGLCIEDPGGCRISPEVKAGLLQLVRELDIHENYTHHIRLNRVFDSAGSCLQLLQARELYTVHQYWIDEYREQYDTSLLRRIYRGMECSTAEVENASLVQEQVRHAFAEFFQSYDYLLMPICPIPSPSPRDWNIDLESDLTQMNAPLSLSILPALILPFRCDGLSCAAQLIVHPQKPEIVPEVLAQLAGYYSSFSQVQ